MSKPNYKMTQKELYSVADTMIDSLEKPATLLKFKTYKPTKYLPAYIADLRAHKKTAFLLPDDTQRSALHTTEKIILGERRDVCTGYFDYIKGYIQDGFPQKQWKAKLKEAGQKEYNKAQNDNWEFVVDLNKKVLDFVAAYPTELAAGHMPLAFGADVQTGSDDFDTEYANFKLLRETGVATNAKLDANNIVYADLKNLQADAHIVFKKDKAALKEFMIKVVRSIVSPPGSASLGLTIQAVGTNLMIAGAKVTIQSLTGVAMVSISDANGEVDFKSLDPDTYKVLIEIVGKPNMNYTKEVDTGVNARMKVMVP